MQVVDARRRAGFLMIAIAVLLASFVVIAPQVQAASGDFSLDFVASAPSSYNHATGGGRYNTRTVNTDIVESLQGGDFTCGDTVTYLLRVAISNTATDTDQVAAFHMSFLADTTGKSGAAHSAVTKVVVNRGAGDTGLVDDGGSAITNISSALSKPVFTKGATLELDFRVTDLDPGERVIVRVDTTLACQPGSSPTGNLFASLTGASVISPVAGKITQGSGNQTIPFQKLGELIVEPQPGEIVVVKQTLPDGDSQPFDFTSSWGAFQLADGESTSSGPLDAGTYSVSETVAAGWNLLSATCDNEDAVSSITVGEGETVTCTFTNELIPLTPTEVTVTPGTCDWIDKTSVTDVSYTVDTGATLTIMLGDVLIGEFTESGSIEVGPGDYTWTATAGDGFEIVGASSGEFTAIDCEVPPEIVTVSLTVGTCTYLEDQSLTDVTVSIDPDGAASILIDGSISMDSDGFSVYVGPGDHSWTATATEGYVLEGTTGGEFTTEACPPPGSIGDTVWHDLNADGLQDEGEPGIEGIEVSLLADGGVIATDTTDIDGAYLFEGLGEADYTVSFAIPDPWVATTPDAGDDAFDSDIDAAGDTPVIALAVGEDNLTVDAGLIQPSTITVEKLTNPVAAGTFDFTGDIEANLAHEESASATVLPGTYTVTETVPDGWALVDITCSDGGSGDLDTATSTFTVASGDEVTCTYTNTNVGTIVLEKATDVATEDTFVFTVGDETVELGSGESVELTLESGTYVITEDLLVVSGWDLASIVCSGESTIDGNSVSLFVPPAQTVGCTFVNSEAEAPLGVIGDFVWDDANADGVQGSNESGLANVGVDLLDAGTGSVIASTTSNAAGVYVLANVPEGDYMVQFSIPDSWVFTGANVGSDDAKDSDVVDITGGTVGRTASFFLAAGSTDTSIDAGLYEIVVAPVPPVTPTPTTPTVTPPVDDTKVLGIQTTLPQTGFADWQAGALALALILGGVGVLLAFRKEEDIVYLTSGFSDRLGL